MKTKQQQDAEEFCAKSKNMFVGLAALLIGALAAEMTDEEKTRMQDAGFNPEPNGKGAVKKASVEGETETAEKITKMKIGEFFVFARERDGKPAEFFPEIDEMIRPAHVVEFLGELAQGRRSYRGHDALAAFNDRRVSDEMATLIRDNPDIRMREKCEGQNGCMEFLKNLKREGCDCGDLIKAAEACCEKNMVPVEDINVEPVYVGYVPGDDYFLSAWDVTGSENTGCVLIAFKIDEDGYVSGYGAGGYRDESLSIYDGSGSKFYEEPKPGKISRSGPNESGTLYSAVSGCGGRHKAYDVWKNE